MWLCALIPAQLLALLLICGKRPDEPHLTSCHTEKSLFIQLQPGAKYGGSHLINYILNDEISLVPHASGHSL